MGKVGFRFLVVFFSWFGALIVFINFVGWSGAYVNISSGGNVDWTNSYFGFQSVQTMISALNITMNSIPSLKVSKFPGYLNQFMDACAFGLPEMLASIGKPDSIQSILKMILMILGGQPIALIAHLFQCVACVVYYAVNFIAILILALGGRFNVPFDNPLTPSDVINAVRISVPMMV